MKLRELILGAVLGVLVASLGVGFAGLVNKPFTFSPQTTAKSSEVNANFDTLYNEFNGNITNSNIGPTAAIAYPKLNLAGSVIDSDISNAAAINGDKLNLAGKILFTHLNPSTVIPTGSSSLVGNARQIVCGAGLTGCASLSSDLTIGVIPQSTNQNLAFGLNTVLIGSPRPWINFSDGAIVAFSVIEDIVNNRFNIGATLVNGSIDKAKLKTSTGSTSAGPGVTVDVTMNDFSFFPSFTIDGGGPPVGTWEALRNSGDPGDTIGRVRINASSSPSGTATFRWRYITASRPPELVVSRNTTTNEILAVWMSEIDDNTRSPLTVHHPNAETVFVAKFPDRLVATDAGLILKDLQSGQLVLGCNFNDHAKLTAEAKSKGRMVFKDAKLCEVVG